MNSLLKLRPQQEAIAPQLNDKIIKDIEGIIGLMREDYNSNSGKNMSMFLEKIGNLLYRRFGIPVKILNDDNHEGPWTMTYSFIDDRTGFDSTSDVIKDGANWLIKIFQKEELARLEDGVKVFDRYLKNNDIVVDLKKAYVYGLPKEYDCFISASWGDLFNRSSPWYAQLDAEVVGVLLHEMGHVFSRLEYLYKTKSTVLALEEAVRDSQKVKSGKGYYYALAYRKNVNPDFKCEDYKDSNLITVGLGIMKDHKDRYAFATSKRSSTNIEFVADQFASRFGYGEVTQKYLTRLILPEVSFYDKSTKAQLIMSFFIVFLFIFGAIAAMASVIAGSIVVIVTCCICYILSCIAGIFYVINGETEEVYDIPYQRVERNVLDAIRQIRLYGDKLDNKDKQRLLVTIDNLQKILKNIKYHGGSVDTVKEEKLFEWLNSKNKNIRELSEFSENIERLMENKLHADAIRF